MNAGRLDTRITLIRIGHEKSEGERTETKTTIATVWAEKREVKGREFEQAQQIASETDTKFTIRYSSTVSDLSSKDRIKIGTDKYDILEVLKIPGGRPRKLEIYTKYLSSENA